MAERTTLAGALAILMATGSPISALEGKLDLPLVTPIKAPTGRDGKEIPPLPKDLWRPGSELNSRGLTPAERALGIAGNAGIASAGLAASVNGFGKNREDTAVAAGFGAVLAVQLWSAWKFLTDPDSRR